jgi:hypothetical protein
MSNQIITKKVKNKFLALFILLGITLLFSSTKIVLIASGYVLEKKIYLDTFVFSNDIKFNIERLTDPEGILNIVRFEGWAFNSNYKPDTERHVSLILKSNNIVYELPTIVGSRPDVPKAFVELNLQPHDLGFSGEFSIIAIEDGAYELYIKVWETGEEATLKSTDRYFEISRDQFKEVKR